MADGADDRDGGGEDRAGDRLVAENGELVGGATTASQDDHVDRQILLPGREARGGALVESSQRADDLPRGVLALDGARRDHDLDERITARQHAEDIVDDRPTRRCCHPDPPRVQRQRALAFWREQALVGKPAAQQLELELRQPDPFRVHQVDVKLEEATRFVQADRAVGHDALADLQPGGKMAGGGSKHDTLELGRGIAQVEVDVAGGRLGETGDLPVDPQVAQERIALEDAASVAHDLAHLENSHSSSPPWVR
jgi:hypothetical protein